MKSKSKKASYLVLAMSGLVLAACQNDQVDDELSGTYQGTGEGYQGDIVTEVTIEDGKLQTIEVVESEETKDLAEPAFENLSEKMIATNSADVDVVTGATGSSNGYIQAVKDALESNDIVLAEENGSATGAASELEDEYEYDVVVVGAGGAGYAAAIEAAEQGFSVTMLEKLPVTGGNTLISGGEMNAPNTWVQEELGIEGDSPEVFFEDTMEGGNYEGQEEMVRIMTDQALESAEWLRDDIEVEFEDQLFQFGGHSFQRALIPKGHTGGELIKKLDAKAKELGVDIYTETSAEELITDDASEVSGILAMNKDKEITFNANEGVILTTGGFGANLEMRQEYNQEYDDRYQTTNSPGAEGQGIVMAQKVGAAVDNMEFIQTYPVSNPETGAISLLADTRFDGAALINQEGNRFVEELDRRDVISEAIIEQPGGYTYQIWDHKLGTETGNLEAHAGELEKLQEQELIYVADTLEEGAEYWDIPLEQFMETIEMINEYAETGEDLEYDHRAGLAPIKEAPFYLQKAVPSVHHTMGGLVINEKTEVLDEEGNPITNLNAAGELTGVIQGANRLGGNAITDIITFGRIAGKTIGQ